MTPCEKYINELIRIMKIIEKIQRIFHPPLIDRIREELKPIHEKIKILHEGFEKISSDCDRHNAEHVSTAFDAVKKFIGLMISASSTEINSLLIDVFKAYHKFSESQESLFRARTISIIDDYFLMDGFRTGDPAKPGVDLTGESIVFSSVSGSGEYARGASAVYCPGIPNEAGKPMLVALHGGFSHGRDFIWTWLREARSMGFILTTPTSIGPTWSIHDPALEIENLSSIISEVSLKYNADVNRIYLTGFSDGGTFALKCAIEGGLPFAATACVSSALPPVDLRSASGKKIYWIHGAWDWMFQAGRADRESSLLRSAGADIQFKIIKDLSHAYPREENPGIIKWFMSKTT
ncbi:MAG: dienelactone hydrolase family protein [Spirochaetes bacterium]|jgi:phospholipase/carboxylesterase|nr:dienelactone hydrolase family protein [Spirochaetota bacterium]